MWRSNITHVASKIIDNLNMEKVPEKWQKSLRRISLSSSTIELITSKRRMQKNKKGSERTAAVFVFWKIVKKHLHVRQSETEWYFWNKRNRLQDNYSNLESKRQKWNKSYKAKRTKRIHSSKKRNMTMRLSANCCST